MTDRSDPGARGAKLWSGGGREELAAAVRRLIDLTLTANAPPAVLADAAERAGTLADELERHVPAGVEPITRFAPEAVPAEDVGGLAAAMPFDVIIGSCNPVALPIDVEFEADRAIGHAVFTAPYEGAPGCVHGAVLAGAFDIMLTAANVMANGAGPTVTLSIRYRLPTRVGQPCRFETWVTSVDDRRTHSRGRLVQGGKVTVEATGEFVNMERSRVESMHRRGPAAPGGASAEGGSTEGR